MNENLFLKLIKFIFIFGYRGIDLFYMIYTINFFIDNNIKFIDNYRRKKLLIINFIFKNLFFKKEI